MAGKRFKTNDRGHERTPRRTAARPDAYDAPKYADLFDEFENDAAQNVPEDNALNDLLDAALENEERSDLQEKNLEYDSGLYSGEDYPTERTARSENITAVKPEKAKRSKKSIVFAILSLFLSLIFIVGGAAFIYAGNLLNSFGLNFKPLVPANNGGNSGGTSPSANTINIEPAEPTGKLSPAEMQASYDDPIQIDGLYHDDAVINILLLGTDDYVGDQGRSDSMMLVSIDRRHQKLKVTSFMRDMYVNLSDGWSPNRLNVAYFLGGPNCLVHTIEDNFHMDIDRYVLVSFEAFEKIIDTLGGVEIELSAAEADYINAESGEVTAYAVAGNNLLTGKQARMYARTRKIGNGDFERTSRQRTIFSSIVKKLKGANVLTLTSVANQIVPEIATDLTQEEMIALLTNALTYMNYEVQQTRIPADDFYYNDAVMISGYESYVLVPDTEWNTIYANDFIYEDDFPELGATLDHYGYKHAAGND